MLFPDAQLREHERAADERGGFDAQDAVAEVRKAETSRTERRTFFFGKAALGANREHGGFRRRGNFRSARRLIRIERELPCVRVEADE